MGQDFFQPLAQDFRQPRQPPRVDQSDAEQVAHMDAVLVAESRKLHAHESLQRHEAEVTGILAFFDLCVRFRLAGLGALSGEDDAHGVTDAALGTIQEDVHRARLSQRGHPAVLEPGSLQCHRRSG